MYLAYVAACIAVVIVPGPTVSVIIANSLRFGARSGLANVAGTQAGLALFLAALVAGFSSVMALVGEWFDVLRIIGAAYLVWLGVRLWLSSSNLSVKRAKKPKGGFFLQGLAIILTNPKVLLFFGAFLPQFIDVKADYTGQLVLLGATFMFTAALLDSIYALLSGGAGAFLSRTRMRLLEYTSGTFLIGGGIWLMLLRRQ